ncbi:TatD family hydrolase [Gryllotalpicola sp.]|uniref:TatD family hydrolase n=1 Tax=Gryllotalpicola sp. TaxID=1932787 RepID=UPI002636ACB1|nr:TatD family hydrolase [Gryllotalpicola sp.]
MPADLTYPPLPEPLAVPVYDNHTHLDPSVHRDIEGLERLSPAEHLDRAAAVGVAGVVQVGVDLETSIWSADRAAVDPRVLAAVALHPNEVPRLTKENLLDDHLAAIADLAELPRVRAIGETGLDFFRTEPQDFAAQIASFEAHIAMAKEHGLALQIHDRDAHAAVVETLLRVGAPERTVFHCFSGDAALARLAADRGWYLSFAGTVTFRNAPNLREALEIAPRELILVETDAPYLTPVPWRGRPNAPYLIPHTVRFMAGHLGLGVDELGAQLAANTVAVYGEW